MSSTIQSKIAPINTNGRVTGSDLIIPSSEAKDSNADLKDVVDFKSLLLNSNDEVKQKRLTESKGDLTGAKSYEDFLQSLNRSTENQRTPKNALDKDDFLKLFVTQLQNQDPLNPKDGTEMASQLAQFNSVEQMINFNKGLERVEAAQKSSNSTNFVNYIGRDVSVKGGRINLTEAGIGNVSFNSPKDVVSATLEIRDAGGTIVKTKELGQVPQGDHQLGWDGISDKGEQLPYGKYSFNIKGKTINGDEVETEITTNLKITGVDMKSSETEFYTDLGKLKPDEISAIGEHGFQNQANALETQKAAIDRELKKQQAQNAEQNQAAVIPDTNTSLPESDSSIEKVQENSDIPQDLSQLTTKGNSSPENVTKIPSTPNIPATKNIIEPATTNESFEQTLPINS